MSQAGAAAGATPPAMFALRPPRPALIVDDASFDRRRLVRLCTQAGLHLAFTEAVTVEEMREAIAAAVFDIVFIDYRLPDGDGLDALGALRADPQNGDAAAVMVAGERDLDVAVTALQQGCDDYLGKATMSPERISITVSEALDRVEMSRARARAAERDDAYNRRLLRLSHAARGSLREDLERLAQACGPGLAEAAAAERLRAFLDEIAEG